MNSKLILEEPLSVAFVITFGIEGDCIIEELIFNASIDDIYGNSIQIIMFIICHANYGDVLVLHTPIIKYIFEIYYVLQEVKTENKIRKA